MKRSKFNGFSAAALCNADILEGLRNRIARQYSLRLHTFPSQFQLPKWYDDLLFFSYFIAYSNSLLNPLIYGGFNHSYRKGYLALISCSCITNRRRTSMLTVSSFNL